MTFLHFHQGFVVVLVLLLYLSSKKDLFPLNIQIREGLQVLLTSLGQTPLFLLLWTEMGEFVKSKAKASPLSSQVTGTPMMFLGQRVSEQCATLRGHCQKQLSRDSVTLVPKSWLGNVSGQSQLLLLVLVLPYLLHPGCSVRSCALGLVCPRQPWCPG